MEPDGRFGVQWGNASNADTTTGQTDATPSPTPPPRDSTSASVDGHPFSPSGGVLQQLQVSKQGYMVMLTNEQLREAMVWPVEVLTPEERALARKVELEQAKQRIAGTTARLAFAHPALFPIIDLHSPSEYGECQGCDGGPDYSGDWPCRTIELILEGLE